MNNNNKNNGIKANKAQQIKLVDIDVKQAKKDIDEIAKYADKKFSDLKNKIGNIGFNGGVSPISFAQSRGSSGGSSLAQSANRPAYTGGKTASIGEYFSSSSGLNFEKIASSLNGSAQARYEAKQIESINNMKSFSNEKVYKDTMKNLKPLVKSGELTQDAARKQAQAAVKQEKINNLLSQSADKFSKSGTVMQVGAKVLTKAGEILMQGVTKGIANQTNAYESTFTNIAVRSGMSNSAYTNYQSNLAGIGGGTIGDFYDNIRTSDIQNQMNNLANVGADSNTILARSMEDVITKTIVPYLDTSSVVWSQLSAAIPNIDKQVRGINSANQKIVGNNYTTEKILNDMLYQVQPMGELAVEQLGKSSGQLSAITNQLMAKGFNEEDAYQIAKEQFNMRYRGASILQNGSVREQRQLISILDKGQNINDLSQSADIAGTQLESDLSLASILPKMGESTIGNVLATAGGDNLGFNGTQLMSTQNLTSKDIKDMVKKANEVGDLTAEEAEAMTKKLANGDLQTKRTKQDIFMENMTNDVDTIIQDLGYWADIIKVAIEGIAGAISLSIVGKGIGALVGSGAGVGGTGAGLLASGGGLALGAIAGVAAIGAIATAVDQGIAKAKARTANDNSASYSGQFETKDESGNVIGDSNSAGALASYAQQYGRDSNTSKWKAGLWDNLGSNFVGSVSNAFNWNGFDENDPVKYNSEKWRRTWNERSGLYDDETMQWVTAAYAMAIMDAGNDSSIIPKSFDDANITADGIKAFMHAKYQDEEMAKHSNEMYQKAANILASLDLYPVGPNRQYSDLAWTTDDLKNWGMYRSGLDYVPYDNYPALLHEGETVLEQNTANQLRHMISKYEDSEQQSVNFREAIQEQTRELVYRLDSILNILSSANTANMVASEMNRIQSPTDANILNMVPVYNR